MEQSKILQYSSLETQRASNPLPQCFGAIYGGSGGTNHQHLYIMREWEGAHYDLRHFWSLSSPLAKGSWVLRKLFKFC